MRTYASDIRVSYQTI
uniref:Uncharacterized protein n=1 Tax=Lepeophtheirus salmonis TaxID=72036 RepID=A0A0K2U4N1_LEPSM